MHSHGVGLLAFLAIGMVGDAAAGQEARDMKLEDVGFVMRPANTPQQMERLRLLPPRTFVARTKAGRRYYIYADPDYCQCVFLGGDSAIVPPETQAQLKQTIKGVTLETIPGTGHYPDQEAPPAFMAIVERFLARIPTS